MMTIVVVMMVIIVMFFVFVLSFFFSYYYDSLCVARPLLKRSSTCVDFFVLVLEHNIRDSKNRCGDSEGIPLELQD